MREVMRHVMSRLDEVPWLRGFEVRGQYGGGLVVVALVHPLRDLFLWYPSRRFLLEKLADVIPAGVALKVKVQAYKEPEDEDGDELV